MRYWVLIALFVAGLAQAQEYFPPPDSEGGWRTATDPAKAKELAGIDLSLVQKAYDVCDRTAQNGGLVVVRRGYLVYERYFGRASRMGNPDMASTGKAVTSIACGIMLEEFKSKIPEGLDTKVFTEQFLPEAFPLDDARKANITLGQLLCMTAGYNGEGQNPVGVANGQASAMKPAPGQNIKDLDQSSIRCRLWTDPGAGYSYSSPSPHVASIVLRHVTGMELKDYVNERLAKPMGWGAWDYCLHRGDYVMPHANGAGSTALHATDALRFAYCLAHGGKWAGKQVVPAAYVALCNQPSKYNPHAPFTLQFEQNSDRHVSLAPRDAFWKSGAGGFCLYVVPSLDLVIYKLGGKDGQWEPALTGLPQPAFADHSREGNNWQAPPTGPFQEGGMGGERRVLELVSNACAEFRASGQ